MKPMRRDRQDPEGSVLLLALLLTTSLITASAAVIVVYQKNLQQSSFFMNATALRRLAESGVAMALHDLRYDGSGQNGNLGSTSWNPNSDFGKDGYNKTFDEGEGDGVPTPGEPGVAAYAVGPPSLGASLCTYVENLSPGLKRIVATCASADTIATVEHYVTETVITIPEVAAMYVAPGVALDLKGSSFIIDGNDWNPDGTPGSGSPLYGIATLEGSPPGANEADIVSQIPSGNYDQVLGAGAAPGVPSVGEVPDVDLPELVDKLMAARTSTLPGGTYSNTQIGNASTGDYPITVMAGDVHFSGDSSAAGILVVDGSVTITGQFELQGLLVVRDDIVLSGGGAGIHIWGSVMVGETITALDEPELTMSGTADIYYSSQVMDTIKTVLSSNPTYTPVYYDEKKPAAGAAPGGGSPGGAGDDNS